MIFDDRAQEAIIHEPLVHAALGKREEPDRVYGLRVTRRLDRLLNAVDKRPVSQGKTIEESIKSSPFRTTGDPLIFPFLALEAKSEKSNDSFSDIEMQTAFTVRTLLKLQDDLRTAAGQESQWVTGPLVWVLTYKGDEWRVAVGYIDYQGGTRNYVSMSLTIRWMAFLLTTIMDSEFSKSGMAQ